MIPDDERVAHLARRIADGETIDWTAELLAAQSADERDTLDAFHAIASVSALHHKTPSEDVVSQPGKHWGPLTLECEIGRGQFGTVYMAWEPRLERHVALKLSYSRQAPGTGSAIREARLLAKVRHPNVLTVHGAEEIDGGVGIWTEYIDGSTLEDELATRGPLPPAEVGAIGIALCQALSAVHGAGLLHRDVKTQNVMRERTGRIVLMDFGAGGDTVAVAARDSVAGTPLYLAPELFRGSPPTVAADIYAAGVTLFRMLTGTFPVSGRTFDDVRVAHERNGSTACRDLAPDVPPTLATTIDRALARDPRDRFASANEFAAALADAVGQQHSPRATAGPPSAKAAVRWMPAAAIGALLTIGGSLAYVAWRGQAFRTDPRDTAGTSANTIVVRQVLPGIAPDFPSNPSSGRPMLVRLDPSIPDLVLTDLSTGTTSRLHVKEDGPAAPGMPGQSVLTADGTRVAFAWDQGSRSELRVLDRATRRVSTLMRSDGESITPFQWSADRTKLLVLVIGAGGRARAELVGSEDRSEQVLTAFRDVPLTMSLSPDDAWLAYDEPSATDGVKRDIAVFDTKTGVAHPVVQHPADDLFPVWTPRGDSLVFASSRTGSLGLWMVDVNQGSAAGEPRLLKDDIGRMWPLGFSSAGTFFFTARSGYVDVFTATVDTGTGTAISAPRPVSRRMVGSNISPAWSPDGRQLAYVSELREGGDRQSRALVVRDWRSDDEHLLMPDLRFFIGPRWSHDGRKVLVKGADGSGRWGLHTINLASAAANAVLLDTAIGQYAWAQGDQSIYYVEHGRVMVHRFRDGVSPARDTLLLDSGTQGITRLAASPVNGALAYSAVDRANGTRRTVLRVRDAAGERELYSATFPEMVMCESWSADGRLVLFSTNREETTSTPATLSELFAAPSDGGSVRRLGVRMDGLREVTLSGDGQLAFTGGWPSRSLWAIDHLPARAR